MLKEIFHKLFDVTTIKFVIVGIINTLFGYGIGLICLNLLHLNFWVSTVANYFLGSVLSYFLNKHYTFRYKGGNAKVVWRYVLEIAACYIISHGIAKPLCGLLLASYSASLRDNVAMVVGLVFFAATNYFGQKFYVFRSKPDKEADK